jgi:hypothetical protein
VRRPSVRERVAPLASAACAWIVSNRRSPGCGSTVTVLSSRRVWGAGSGRCSIGSRRPVPRPLPRLLDRSRRRSTRDSVPDIAARPSVPSVGGPPPRRCSSRVQRRSRRALGLPLTWRSVHAAADSRVLLHRRVRVPRRRCHRRVTSSFLGFVSPSRRCLHSRGCPRSPEDPIPPPVCVVGRGLLSEGPRRTAGCVCPGVGAATVAGHGLPGVLDVKERLLRTWGSRPSPEGGRLSPPFATTCSCNFIDREVRLPLALTLRFLSKLLPSLRLIFTSFRMLRRSV